MGHRLSRIYTRTGDDGTTGLANGERIFKHDPRVIAFGCVDETNSAIGLVLAEPIADRAVGACLRRVQSELFELGAELSAPEYVSIGDADVTRLETDLDALNARLPPLKEFILPGGNRAAAACHLARTICRRAERAAWALNQQSALRPALMKYLNRLSDLLFVAARSLAREDGGQEILWDKRR